MCLTVGCGRLTIRMPRLDKQRQAPQPTPMVAAPATRLWSRVKKSGAESRFYYHIYVKVLHGPPESKRSSWFGVTKCA